MLYVILCMMCAFEYEASGSTNHGQIYYSTDSTVRPACPRNQNHQHDISMIGPDAVLLLCNT